MQTGIVYFVLAVTAYHRLLCLPYEAPLANIKMECQRWPEKPLILGRSGTQYVAAAFR